MVSPERRRAAVAYLVRRHKVSERRACRLVGQNRSTQRYEHLPTDEEERLVRAMSEIAAAHPRYGYRPVCAVLRQQGWKVNHKRVERLWRLEDHRVPPARLKDSGKKATGGSENAVWTRRERAHLHRSDGDGHDQPYAPLGDLASTTYTGTVTAHSVTDTYDAEGNRVQMVDGTGTSGYSYDPFGEMTASENGAGQTTSYSYDADGNTRSITYPLPLSAMWATGDSVNYTYNNADVLTKVTDFNGNAITVANTPDGLPNSLTLGSSGDTITTSYDNTDSPYSINVKQGSSALLGFAYSRAPSRVVTSESDTPALAGEPAAYTYDAESRIASMTPGPDPQLTYSEDASGNLTQLPTQEMARYDSGDELVAQAGGATIACPDGSSVSNATTVFCYDEDGNLTATETTGGEVQAAAWNGSGRLLSYSSGGQDMTSALYNGDGLRTSTTISSVSEHFVWDANISELLMDSNYAYVRSESGALEQVSLATGEVNYLVCDALGSVRAVLTSSGSLAGTASYDAWGNVDGAGVSSLTALGFAGAYTDPTGILYMTNRYYNPATGQFLSRDPLAALTHQNYGYASDDPVNGSDPTGLAPSCTASCKVMPPVCPERGPQGKIIAKFKAKPWPGGPRTIVLRCGNRGRGFRHIRRKHEDDWYHLVHEQDFPYPWSPWRLLKWTIKNTLLHPALPFPIPDVHNNENMDYTTPFLSRDAYFRTTGICWNLFFTVKAPKDLPNPGSITTAYGNYGKPPYISQDMRPPGGPGTTP